MIFVSAPITGAHSAHGGLTYDRLMRAHGIALDAARRAGLDILDATSIVLPRPEVWPTPALFAASHSTARGRPRHCLWLPSGDLLLICFRSGVKGTGCTLERVRRRQ